MPAPAASLFWAAWAAFGIVPPRSGAGSALGTVAVVVVEIADVDVLVVARVLTRVGVAQPAAGQGQDDGEGGGEPEVEWAHQQPCRVSLDEPAVAGGLVAGVLGGDD